MRRPGRFLFVTFDGGGNMTPTLGAARELAARGHEVVFLGQRSQEARVEQRGFGFTPFGHAAEWARGIPVEEERDALLGFFFGPDTASDARLAIERTQPHAIVVDCLLSAALAAAEKSSLPVAALFHLLYQPFVDGGFARQWAASMPTINQTRRLVGLAPIGSAAELFGAVDLALVGTVEQFDFPASERAANVRYVGPIFDDEGDTEPTDVPREDRQLVLVSLSTARQPVEEQLRQEQLLRRAAGALAELPVQGLITLGDLLPSAGLSAPENVLVRRYLPHAAVLPRVELVVCHAGFWTVMAALRHGVPLVCAPTGRDQFNNAQRVEALGVGRTIAADADEDEIRGVIADVLATPSYREAARGLQEAIAAAGGSAGAADELEALAAGPR